MKKKYLFIAAFVFLSFSLSAQSNGGAIKVTLVDKKNPKESIPFANVVVYNGKTQVAVGTTDMDGNVMIKPLNAGKYNIKAVYVGYQPQQVNDVVVNNFTNCSKYSMAASTNVITVFCNSDSFKSYIFFSSSFMTCSK